MLDCIVKTLLERGARVLYIFVVNLECMVWKSVLRRLPEGEKGDVASAFKTECFFPVESGKCITSGSRTKPLGQLIVIY